MLFVLTWAWAPAAALAAPDERPQRVIAFIDADNPRVRDLIRNLQGALARSGASARHRVVIRHVVVDLWNSADIEAKTAQALAGHPAAIVASNNQNAMIAKRLAHGVPVIFGSRQDPVRVGLVESLARPGGNLTGFTFFVPIDQKRLELLRQLAPGAKRLGILVDRWWSGEFGGEDIVREARARLGFEAELFLAETTADLQRQLSTAKAREMDAWYVPYTGLPFEQPAALLGLFEALRKPVVFPATLFVERGGLISYQQTLTVDEIVNLLATMIELILDGVPAGEIPIERPKAFELAINVAAARRIGVVIPGSLVRRADRVFLGEPGLAGAAK